MTKLVVVCLGLLVTWQVALSAPYPSEAFELATHSGEPNVVSVRSFFVLSTSAGKYVIRQDGMGEFTPPTKIRRVFRLRVGARGHIERIYFLEHDHDLFLMYEVYDASSAWYYLARLEQTKRRQIWLTPIPNPGAPVMDGDAVIIDRTMVSKADGRIVSQD
jgi:hypothetical protein